MPIDVESFRATLKQIEAELLAGLEKSETDARETPSAEVEDPVDRANTDSEKDLVLDEETREYDKLRQVQEALERIDDGTFGICLDCGREIPGARLKAVPWAAYCVEDQEKREPRFMPSTL